MRLTLAALLAFLQPVSAFAQFRARPLPAGAPLGVPALVAPALPNPTLLPKTPAAALPITSSPMPSVQAAPAVKVRPALPVPAVAAPPAALPAAVPQPTAFGAAAELAGPRGEASIAPVFDGARPAAQANAVLPSVGVREGSWDLRPAARGAPSVVAVGPRNFELQAEEQDPGDLLDEMTAIKDHDARHFHLLTTRRIDPMEAESVLRSAGPSLTREAAQGKVRALPALLKAHFARTLARHAHQTTERAGASVHTVADGLPFWVDFALPAAPDERAAAAVFLSGSARGIFSKDPAYGLVRSLTQGLSAFSRVVDASALSPAGRAALVRLAEDQGHRTARFGRWLLVGSGASFHLTRSILASAQELSDPALAAKLDKVLAFLAARGIDIDHDQHLAAAAFYHPLDRRLAYVMPSRADLNAFSHEGTHARFHAFEERLDRWLRKRRLALPYEADGPAVAIIGRGGYFNLLNELNSWRLGEGFDGGKSDADILAILRDSYGRQAGAEAAAAFGRLWSEERVRGVPVPRLILRSVRALNALDEAGVDALGRRALEAGDGGAQRDFLRLARARHEAGTSWPAERGRLLALLAERGADEGVRGAAERLLRPEEEDPAPGSRAAARKAREAYSEAAVAWIKGLAAEKAVIPFDLTFGAETVLRFAHEQGLADYDAVIAGLQARFGREEAEASDSERALFAAVLARPEAGVEAKLRGYLADFNARGFAALWAEFPDNPDYDLRELLAERHAGEFTAAHAAQLARWALASDAPETLRSGAASLLGSLLSARGVETIYPSHQLESLRGMQRAMNASNGLPADAHMPANRPPGAPHPLLGPELDRALAEGMFDGKPGIHRLKVIELVTQRTYPEELPELRRRVASVLAADDAAKFDQWVARMFLVPADSILFDAHARWGAALARAALEDATPNATALEFVGEHLRQGLGAALKGPSWGRHRSRLDAAARKEALEAVAGYDREDAAAYRRALDDLWRLLNHPDRKVSRSALYAVAERPVFFVGLEDRFAAAPGTPGLAELLAMTEPGFVPALEAAAAAARAPLAPASAFGPAPLPAPRAAPAAGLRWRLRLAAARAAAGSRAALGRPYRALLRLFRETMTRLGALFRKYVSGREMDAHTWRWSVLEGLHQAGDFRGSFGHPVHEGAPEVMSPLVFPEAAAKALKTQSLRIGGRVEAGPMLGVSGMSYPQLSAQSHLSLLYVHLRLAKELGVRTLVNTGEGGPGLHLALLSGDKDALLSWVLAWNRANGRLAAGDAGEAKVTAFVERLLAARAELFKDFSPADLAKAQVVAQFGSALNGIRGPDGRVDPAKLAAVGREPGVAMVQYKLKQAAKRGAKVDAKKLDLLSVTFRGLGAEGHGRSPELTADMDSAESVARLVKDTRRLTAKPVSLKFGVGDAADLLAFLTVLRDAGALPDHIQLDGRGADFSPGSGNAPPGANTSLPLNEAVLVADAVLKKLGVRERVVLDATGDVLLPAEAVEKLALGADLVSGARAWMGMGLGCAMVRSCADGSCPYGIASRSDGFLGLALDPRQVGPKGYAAAANWHKAYVQTLAEAGLSDWRGARRVLGPASGRAVVRKKEGGRTLALDQFYSSDYVASLLRGALTREEVERLVFGR